MDELKFGADGYIVLPNPYMMYPCKTKFHIHLKFVLDITHTVYNENFVKANIKFGDRAIDILVANSNLNPLLTQWKKERGIQ